MWGLGDNIYQRPFIQMLSERTTVYLETPWPELYADLPNVRFVLGKRNLRTQLKNIARQDASRWSRVPRGVPTIALKVHYNLQHHSIIQEMANCFRIGDRVELSLPPQERWTVTFKPIAIIRPVTVRREWHNSARNPEPNYVNYCAEQLRQTHHVIVLADLEDGQEELVGNLPPHDTAWINGQVKADRLFALVQAADVLVGGVGWIVPAAVAARKRAFVVLGGQGGHNAPEKILAPWWKHRITFAEPDNFCRCINMRHSCQKTISNLAAHFTRFIGHNATI